MKRFYQMFLALALIMLGATTASGQKIYRAELDKSMFKAWDGCGADAKEVADPQPIDVSESNPEGTKFSCDFNLYKEVGDWSGIYGSTAAYYLWYADLTGTKKMYFKGTAGKKFWVQFNRQAPVEGGDSHGGDMVQSELTIGADGTLVYEIPETMEYVHLNCIKTKGGAGAGVLTSIEIEGTVKPVTGILSMINNGDVEGDDLSSFPVSYNGGTDLDDKGATGLPEIVEGGVDGSHCLKVVSNASPVETWTTQFYIKADEIMPRGTKWKLVMSIKADHASKISTSAQGLPRAWKGGFIDAFTVSDEWKEYSWTGEIGVDDFQSIAFDLNNGEDGAGNGGCAFFFDNIQFGIDLGGANPMSNVGLGYASNVVRVDFANNTNMKDLVEAKGITITVPDETGENMVKTKSLIFDNSSTTITWNGKACSIASVEGRTDGNLYIFLKDMDGQGGEEYGDDAEVKIAFKNPADNDHHLTFKEGKWAGEAVPDFDGLVCPYDASMTEMTVYSYLFAAPELLSAEPENGSFNLPVDTKNFVMTFTQPVNVETVKAKLGDEDLAVVPATGFEKAITLTRTGEGELSGVKQLIIAAGVANADETPTDEAIVLTYNFGPIVIDPNDQAEELISASYFEDCAGGGIPVGYKVTFGAEERVAPNTYGSGSCMKTYNEGGDFKRALYFREGNVLYGTVEGYELTLKAGKKYDLQFNSMNWKGSNEMKFEILNEADEAVYTENITPALNINGAQNVVVSGSTLTKIAFTPEADGNYKLKWTSDGFRELMIAKVSMSYTPNIPGLVETAMVNEALEAAKAAKAANENERYAGVAYTNLANKIQEYDGVTFTTPSVCQKAADELNAATKAMTDHHTACDTYDGLAPQTLQIVDNNAEKKFATLEAYATMKNLVAKYEVTKEEEIQGEGDEQKTVTVYKFKVLTDDDELAAANKEIEGAINLTNLLFTEGVSTPENSNGGKGTGIAVFVDRLRLGAEDLKGLGVAEDDELVVKANNALTDDDDLAQYLMTRTTQEVYGKLKDADDKFFQTITVDDETLEETVEPKEYDMTVFVKNPNIYKQQPNMNFTLENVPGWTTPDGYNQPGLSVGWGAPKNIEGVAEDCMFQTWGAAYRAEQTITNLPVGIYTVKFGFGERNDDASNEFNLAYVKTSKIKEGEQFTDSIQPKVIGQTFPFAGATNAAIIDSVEVKDGLLTIGVNAGTGSHTFFNEVRLVLVGAVKDFDYGKAYADGIETIENKEAVRVRAIELYDLNGRRVTKATKGLVIMKKVMNDGTVRTQKVVK